MPTSYEYILALPTPLENVVNLAGPLPIGESAEGNELFWSRDSRGFGIPISDRLNPSEPIKIVVQLDTTTEPPPFTRWGSGGYATDEGKRIIESYNIPNVECFPAEAHNARTGERLPDMWLVNCFNWVDLVDLENSDVDRYFVDLSVNRPEEVRYQHRHGEYYIQKVRRLELKNENFEEHLYLIDGPVGELGRKLYISLDLFDALFGSSYRSIDREPELVFLGHNFWETHLHPLMNTNDADPYFYFGRPETKGRRW